MTTRIAIGTYLLNRLKEINIDTIFGLPGDYNMPFLDLIEDDESLTWGNNANELNAAYAADGYARVRGAGAIVTTFGVGELSALNGIAGAYAEMLPVIHIVGCPKTQDQADGALMHHTLGDGDFKVFSKMSEHISVATALLTVENAAEKIDHVVKTSFLRKRPGYIGIPLDLLKKEIEVSDAMLKPLDLSIPPNPKKVQEKVLSKILKLIEDAKHPAIVIDGCVFRQRVCKEANDFVVRSGFPTFAAPMGKGAIDDSLRNYRGCYCGKPSLEGVKKEIEQADLLIEIGSFKVDSNTGGFTYGLEDKTTISLHSTCTIIDHAEYPGVNMVELLPLLTSRLPKVPRQICFPDRAMPPPIDESTDVITHNYFWNKVPEYIDVGGIMVTETGTAQNGAFEIDAPKDTTFITQLLWNSIGYTVGAALGAAMAARKRRVYLFVGDGSYQLVCQEVSVMLRHGITPVIFLLNNDGYVIEKLIHGRHRHYNNFQMWEYSRSLEFFGAHLTNNKTKEDGKRSEVGFEGKVSNRKEFETAMSTVTQQPDRIHFLEVIMPPFDAPRELIEETEV